MVIRSLLAKFTVLALASICASVAVVGCSSSSDNVADGGIGEFGLRLTIAPDVDISEVTFTVSGNGITAITNRIPVGALGSTISAVIGGIPAGSGYTVTLSAIGKNKVTGALTDCGGSAPLTIIAGQTTSVSIALQCRGPKTTGGVEVGGRLNNCPTIDSATTATKSRATAAAPTARSRSVATIALKLTSSAIRRTERPVTFNASGLPCSCDNGIASQAPRTAPARLNPKRLLKVLTG